LSEVRRAASIAGPVPQSDPAIGAAMEPEHRDSTIVFGSLPAEAAGEVLGLSRV
jgi:hypothetical protein